MPIIYTRIFGRGWGSSFPEGVLVFLGKISWGCQISCDTGSELCPVAAMADYLCARGMAPGPLFLLTDGKVLSRQRFVDAVRDALKKAKIDQTKYCGHSFRIGAATTAAAKGLEDSIIKTLGRWESTAYLQYVKIPRQQLAGVSTLLASP